MNKKLMNLNIMISDENTIIQFVLFPRFKIDAKNSTLEVSVADEFQYLFNDLVANFSILELLEDLKTILRCTADTYNQFKRFNDLVLKRCQKEIHEKTNCRFSYAPIRRGRFVRTIRFTVETMPDIEVSDSDQLALNDYYRENDYIELFRDACCPLGSQISEFSQEEMEQIFQVLINIHDDKLPTVDINTGNINLRRYHYLAERYAAMNRANEKNPIKNRFSYFLKMIKVDAGIN